MKTTRAPKPIRQKSSQENGFAVLIVLVLLAIISTFSVANNVALKQLNDELRLVEKREVRRWTVSQTNAPAVQNRTVEKPK